MADLNPQRHEAEPNFRPHPETSFDRDQEIKTGKIEEIDEYADGKKIDSSSAEDEKGLASKQNGSEAVIPSLDQINTLPESGQPLSDEAKITFLESMVKADTRENFPKNVSIGTAAAELQNLTNEVGSE